MTGAVLYEIHVRDVLDEKWKDHFPPFTLTPKEEDTLLSGLVHNQAELLGVLLKICNLGLSLISVNPVFDSQALQASL
jgi:hypothetical protein